jgi:hypothetical protein
MLVIYRNNEKTLSGGDDDDAADAGHQHGIGACAPLRSKNRGRV